MKIRTKTKYKISAVAPRLSDEDVDPLEKDDPPPESNPWMAEDWLPWDADDVADIRRLIASRLCPKEQFILESFLDGLNYKDINVTEKYWRYHFSKGVEFIKKELKL